VHYLKQDNSKDVRVQREVPIPWFPKVAPCPTFSVTRRRAMGPFHTDVSVRACTFCPPLLITNKQKGCTEVVWSLSCWS